MPSEGAREGEQRSVSFDVGTANGTDARGPKSRDRRVPRSRIAVVGATLFIAVSLIHLVIVAFGAWPEVRRVTQGALTPVLALWAFAPLPAAGRIPRRLGVPLALALAFSAAGDIAPGFLAGDAGFLSMTGAFFVAQLAWIAVLLPWRRHSIARPGAWPLVLAYGAIAIAVMILVAPGAGWLVLAIVPYAAALATTGVLATALGPAGTIGGLLFIVSDAMIAIFSFAPLLDPGEPVHSLAIMSTYCAAQGVLVLALRSTLVAKSPSPTSSQSHSHSHSHSQSAR